MQPLLRCWSGGMIFSWPSSLAQQHWWSPAWMEETVPCLYWWSCLSISRASLAVWQLGVFILCYVLLHLCQRVGAPSSLTESSLSRHGECCGHEGMPEGSDRWACHGTSTDVTNLLCHFLIHAANEVSGLRSVLQNQLHLLHGEHM